MVMITSCVGSYNVRIYNMATSTAMKLFLQARPGSVSLTREDEGCSTVEFWCLGQVRAAELAMRASNVLVEARDDESGEVAFSEDYVDGRNVLVGHPQPLELPLTTLHD